MIHKEFLDTLQSLGATDKDRAAKLGVNPKTIERARRRMPDGLLLWGAVPALLRAAANDLERNPVPSVRHKTTSDDHDSCENAS